MLIEIHVQFYMFLVLKQQDKLLDFEEPYFWVAEGLTYHAAKVFCLGNFSPQYPFSAQPCLQKHHLLCIRRLKSRYHYHAES